MNQFTDWTSRVPGANYDTLAHVPTPRPALATRFQQWQLSGTNSDSGTERARHAGSSCASYTPRLSYRHTSFEFPAGSRHTGSPAPPSLQRNVTPLKRASDAVWPYPILSANPQIGSINIYPQYYMCQSSESINPLSRPRTSDQPTSHYRSHTPPPGLPLYHHFSPVSDMPVFGYRAMAVPRSVTPPPNIGNHSSHDGWISMSTADMSPFMILRIKALIELCAIPSPPHEEKIIVTTSLTPHSLKSCLRVRKTQEQIEKDNEMYKEDPDSRTTTLLNHLLEQSRTYGKTNSSQLLSRANEEFSSDLGNELSTQDDRNTVKLNFSPGATLICFESGDKPRKIRENHSKHYAHFLLQQRSIPTDEPSSSTIPTTPRSLLKTQHSSTPQTRSLTPPISRMVAENQ